MTVMCMAKVGNTVLLILIYVQTINTINAGEYLPCSPPVQSVGVVRVARLTREVVGIASRPFG
jgi:hypothetical protein